MITGPHPPSFQKLSLQRSAIQYRIPVSTTSVTVTGLPKTFGAAWDMIRNDVHAHPVSQQL
jgi:hypothetical protein